MNWKAKIEYQVIPGITEQVGRSHSSIFSYFLLHLNDVTKVFIHHHFFSLSEHLTFLAAQMSRKNIGFLDVKAISPDVLVDLFVDVLADEKGILRAVFGYFFYSLFFFLLFLYS